MLRLLSDAAPTAVPLPLPGEPRLRVEDDDAARSRAGGAAASRSRSSTRRLRLGSLGLRLELQGGSVRAVVAAPRRRAARSSRAPRRLSCEEALARVTGKQAQVRVDERREPLDVYA